MAGLGLKVKVVGQVVINCVLYYVHSTERSILGLGLPRAALDNLDTWNTVQDICMFVSDQGASKTLAQRSRAFNLFFHFDQTFSLAGRLKVLY